MRVLTAALALSAGLHTAAIAWVRLQPADKAESSRVVAVEPIAILAPAPGDPEPITVALLPDHSVPTAGRVAEPRRPAPVRIAATASTATREAARTAEPTAAPPARSPWLAMRKPDPARPSLERGPSAAFTSRFLAASRPPAPKEVADEQIADEIAAARDNLADPRWVRNATPEQLAGERLRLAHKLHERDSAVLQPDGAGKKSEHETFTLKVAPDGTVDLHDKPNVQRKGLLHGTFDATDAVMRSRGIDPYASKKLALLDKTRDQRVAIGKRYRTEQLARSRALVQHHIERLLASAPDPRALREGLFELWDDCAETGAEELVAGGRAARDHVLGFIRSRLPPGSKHAFGEEELARLNRIRRSQAVFAPYR